MVRAQDAAEELLPVTLPGLLLLTFSMVTTIIVEDRSTGPLELNTSCLHRFTYSVGQFGGGICLFLRQVQMLAEELAPGAIAMEILLRPAISM